MDPRLLRLRIELYTAAEALRIELARVVSAFFGSGGDVIDVAAAREGLTALAPCRSCASWLANSRKCRCGGDFHQADCPALPTLPTDEATVARCIEIVEDYGRQQEADLARRGLDTGCIWRATAARDISVLLRAALEPICHELDESTAMQIVSTCCLTNPGYTPVRVWPGKPNRFDSYVH